MFRVPSNKEYVASDTDRTTEEHMLPAQETLPQHTRSKPSRRQPVIPVGTRVEAKFQRDKMWYVGRVGSVYGSVRDEEVSYAIDFDDGDTTRRVRRERLLE